MRRRNQNARYIFHQETHPNNCPRVQPKVPVRRFAFQSERTRLGGQARSVMIGPLCKEENRDDDQR